MHLFHCCRKQISREAPSSLTLGLCGHSLWKKTHLLFLRLSMEVGQESCPDNHIFNTDCDLVSTICGEGEHLLSTLLFNRLWIKRHSSNFKTSCSFGRFRLTCNVKEISYNFFLMMSEELCSIYVFLEVNSIFKDFTATLFVAWCEGNSLSFI